MLVSHVSTEKQTAFSLLWRKNALERIPTDKQAATPSWRYVDQATLAAEPDPARDQINIFSFRFSRRDDNV